MDDLTFLQDSEPGNASMVILFGAGKYRVDNLHLPTIENVAPLLAHCFEERGRIHLYTLESEFPAAVICLLRYIYLGDYEVCEAMAWSDNTCSILLHLQIISLSQHFQISGLETQAYNYFRAEFETSLDSVDRPMDLFEGTRFLYSHLASCMDLRSMLAHYCVFAYAFHMLGQDATFHQVVYELPVFHRDLQTVNTMTNFRSSLSSEIVQLPVRNHTLQELEDAYPSRIGELPFNLLQVPPGEIRVLFGDYIDGRVQRSASQLQIEMPVDPFRTMEHVVARSINYWDPAASRNNSDKGPDDFQAYRPFQAPRHIRTTHEQRQDFGHEGQATVSSTQVQSLVPLNSGDDHESVNEPELEWEDVPSIVDNHFNESGEQTNPNTFDLPFRLQNSMQSTLGTVEMANLNSVSEAANSTMNGEDQPSSDSEWDKLSDLA